MENYKEIYRMLNVLDNEDRLRILGILKDNSGNRLSFNQIYNDVFKSKISKLDLCFHLRILYISKLITNDGNLEEAEFKITDLGIKVLDSLEKDLKIEKIFCNK